MTIQADINQVITELSNQVAIMARENAILKSMIAQYEKALSEKEGNVATPLD